MTYAPLFTCPYCHAQTTHGPAMERHVKVCEMRYHQPKPS